MKSDLYPLLSIVRLRMGTDGSGVTSLVAGAGCPLNCRWCINKDLLKRKEPEWISAEELYDRVKIDDLYFQASGGGITFGGGEPLLYPHFLRSFRRLCPPTWRINVETSLAVSQESLKMLLEYVDEFIVDCKDMDPIRYESYTGQPAKQMLENLELLRRIPDKVLVRVPRIPRFNTEEDQKNNADLLRAMGFTRLDLFEYVIRT